MSEGGDQAAVLARLASEHDNLRAALEWARDSREDEVLLRLSVAVAKSWIGRGLYQETDAWLSLALDRASSPVKTRMEALRASCIRAAAQGQWARADALVAEWRSLAEQAGDEYQVLLAMNSTAMNAVEQGRLANARAQFVAIGQRADEIGQRGMVAFVTVNLGYLALRAGDFHAGLDYSESAADLFRERGDDSGLAVALENCGWNSLGLSDPARAEASFRDALEVVARLGWLRGVAVNAVGLGVALIARQEEERGVQLLGAAASIREELGVGLDDEQEKQTHARAVADAQAVLGEEAFSAAWVQGEAMTPAQIVAFAQAG